MNKLLSALIAVAFAGLTLTAVAADPVPAAAPAAAPAADAKPMEKTEKPMKKHHKKHAKKAVEADPKPADAAPAK